jgi:hypothetical protein
MSTIFLRFAIVLENPEIEKLYRHHGLLFHRWLPDGEKDALIFNTGNENIIFKVWFERFGYLNNDFIEFNLKRREVDDQNMQQQGILEAGPLFGLLEISNITQKELEQITKDIKRDEDYVSLGKRIIKRLIYPQISNLLNIFRLIFGQYWIREFDKWDSRNNSLGTYCELIELQWSLDGKSWKPFVPDEPEISFTIEITSNKDFLEYITKEDWNIIKKLAWNNFEGSIAGEYISQSNFYLYQGNLRHAIIDGITALEIIIEEFITFNIYNIIYPIDFTDYLGEMKLMKKLKMVSNFSGMISPKEIDDIEKIYQMRNNIVHQGGKLPNNCERDIKDSLRILLKAISKLLPWPNIKFPSPNPGNARKSIELWEKEK